jgi:hypothetical protein
MLLSLIGTSIDIPAFLVTVLTGSVTAANGSGVPPVAQSPQYVIDYATTHIPALVVYKESENWMWLSIPAVRRRHYSQVRTEFWATTMQDRFAMMTSTRVTVNSFAAATIGQTSYPNFVWMHIIDENENDMMDIIPPIYRSDFLVEVIYDETLPTPSIL